VLSGNRNLRAAFIRWFAPITCLAAVVVAYALRAHGHGPDHRPLGNDSKGVPVYLKDIWPTPQEIETTVRASVTSAQYSKQYSEVFEGDAHLEVHAHSERRHLQVGPENRLHQAAAVFSITCRRCLRRWRTFTA